MQTFSTIVIGAGLMGSAAARYLSQSDPNIGIIGPAEPADQVTHDGVYASHYDQGRLTSAASKNLIWSRLVRRSMEQYGTIEAEAGIKFYRPVGKVQAEGPHSPAPESEALMRVAQAEGVAYTRFAAGDDGWRASAPGLDFPGGFWVIYEPAPAGMINPRGLCQAQLRIAQQQGATLIRATVTGVAEDEAGVTVSTDDGNAYRAEKVIVAAGAFTNFNDLLPRELPLRLKTETIILAQVTPERTAELAEMPIVGYQIMDPDIDDIYMTPPVQYPDGNFYVKMGCNTRTDTWPATLEEVRAWFQSGDSETCKPAMAAAVRAMMPDTEFLGFQSGRCIVCYTPSGLPTIDWVSERILTLAGGNGSSAQCSDTLGRLAAGVAQGEAWPDDLPRDPFLLHEWDTE
ncbi:MAG: FAD-binding oxidoreductase [Caldilineaceae bacterium]|nr:FAD-binding oxidoreductase [Caldilineaceae bacterium]